MTEASIATGFRTASEVFDHCRMLTSNRRSSDRRTALERGTFSKRPGVASRPTGDPGDSPYVGDQVHDGHCGRDDLRSHRSRVVDPNERPFPADRAKVLVPRPYPRRRATEG